MDIILARVPGEDLSDRLAAFERVAATALNGRTAASSAVVGTVLTMKSWPGTSSRGAWPVWTVVTPKLQTQWTSASRGL